MNLRPAIYTPWPAVAPWRRRLRPLLLSTFAFDSLRSRFAHRYPRGSTVHVARPARSILLSTFAFLLSTFLALPSASAFEWQNSGIWDSDSVDRAFDSGPAWFTAGPSWMMNAMPGAHFRARQYVLDSAGDREQSTTEAPYVGTLHDVFNVSSFNSIDGRTDWNGTSSSTFSTAANWTPNGGTPGSAPPVAGDVAWFSSTPTNKTVNLTTSPSLAGLYFTGTTASGYLLTRTSPNAYTLTGSATAIGTEISDATAVAIGAENTSGTNTISVAITLAPTGTTSTFYQAAGGTLSLASSISVISGSGISLSLIGGGTFIFGGANTYSGGTTLTSGTLQLGTSSVAGTSGPVGLGGTLSLNGGKLTSNGGTTRTLLNPISLDADSQIGDATNSGILNLNGSSFTLNGNHQLTVNSNATIAGIISGSPSSSTFTKLGSANLTLGGGAADASANTYTGLTTVSAGNLALNKAAGTTAIAGDLTINGTGTVSLSANEQIANTASVTISSSSGAAFSVGSRTETIANLTIDGVTGVNAVTGGSGTLIIAGAGTITANTGNITVTNLTTGTGGLIMGSGVTVSSSTSGGVTTLNGDVTFNGSTTGATLGSTSAPSSGITLNGNRNFTVADATAASDLTVAGVISNGTVAGSGLTKLGAGTLLLSAANTYTGATQVNAGTLYVNGSLNASSAVTVNNSGTVLGGTGGTINGPVSIASSGAILQGGTGSTGQTLTLTGAVTMSTGSVIQLALGPTLTHSTIAIGSPGTLSFATNQDFKFIEVAGATIGTYTGIITGVPNPGTALTTWVIDNPGYTGAFTWDALNGGEIDLTLTAIPEPSTWIGAALALGAVGVMKRGRFRKKLKA